jgi:signal transduction histidine kinase
MSKGETDSTRQMDLLAQASHEMRTPLSVSYKHLPRTNLRMSQGVIGIAALLRDTQLSSSQLEFVATIQKSAEAVLQIVNEVLAYSKGAYC